MAYQTTLGLLAIYYSVMQVDRYARNEDSSQITFRPFNDRPIDNYPDLTFCIDDGNGHFKEAVEEFQVSNFSFSDVLKGNTSLETKAPELFEKITNVHPNVYFTGIEDILLSYSFKTNKEPKSYSPTKDVKKRQDDPFSPFFGTVHQDPDKICFTRHSQSESGTKIVRRKDEFVFNFKDMPGTGSSMKLFLHYPGQFIRHLETPVAESQMNRGDWSQRMVLTIPAISTLRKRSTKSDPCNDNDEDDAQVFREQIINDVGCIPGYWKSLAKQKRTICNTTDVLEKIFKNISNTKGVLSKSRKPCYAMMIPLTVQKDTLEELNQLHISVLYSATEYEEINNFRDFDFDSMFSGIGGFVGIFLGYSLLQATEILEMNWIKNLRASIFTAISSVFLFSSIFFKGSFTLLI